MPSAQITNMTVVKPGCLAKSLTKQGTTGKIIDNKSHITIIFS